MVERYYPQTPLLAACTAIWRDDRILLARRKIAPNSGSWAMPGGLIHVGERLEEAAIREVKEETRLDVSDLIFNRFEEIIISDQDGKTKRHFVLAMFVARSISGLAVAGDDADAVSWFGIEELQSIPLTGNSETFIRESYKIFKG